MSRWEYESSPGIIYLRSRDNHFVGLDDFGLVYMALAHGVVQQGH